MCLAQQSEPNVKPLSPKHQESDLVGEEIIILIVVTLVVGVLIRTIIGSKPTQKVDKDDQDTHVAQTPVIDTQKEFQMLKEALEKDPANRNAWVQLGNKHFDANQQIEAVEAYDKALAIEGDDPNVLTDQGVMYRKNGWFGKANKLDPRHLQSLLNMGIVYRFDLKQKDKAKEACLNYLEIDSTGATADRVRTMIEHMGKGHE